MSRRASGDMSFAGCCCNKLMLMWSALGTKTTLIHKTTLHASGELIRLRARAP